MKTTTTVTTNRKVKVLKNYVKSFIPGLAEQAIICVEKSTKKEHVLTWIVPMVKSGKSSVVGKPALLSEKKLLSNFGFKS